MQPENEGKSARFEWTLVRPEENHAKLLAAIEQYSRDRVLTQKLRYRLGVIIDELVMNAIMHGRCTGEHQTLSVSICDQPDMLLIEIIDSGLPFDPTAHVLSGCPAEGKELAIGGVGLCLVRHLTDRMEYSRHGDRNMLLISLYKTNPEDVCSCRK